MAKVKWERVSIGSYGNYYRTIDTLGREWTLEQSCDYSWDIKCNNKCGGTEYPPQALSNAKRRAAEMLGQKEVGES